MQGQQTFLLEATGQTFSYWANKYCTPFKMSYVSSKVKSENDIKTPSTLKYMNCFIFDLNN